MSAKPPILFLHGMFAHPGLMSDWVALLRDAGYDVAVPAMPGHDPVDRDVLTRVTLTDYVDTALAAYDDLPEAPIVIGHSIGGLVAQHVAAARDPIALVLLAPVPPGILWPQLHSLPHLAPLMPNILRGRPIMPSDRTFRDVPLYGLPPEEQAEIAARFVPDSAHVFRSMSLGTRDTRVDPRSVTAPVLCVSGGSDRNVSTATSRQIARRYRAEHQHHPRLPHWIIATSAIGEVAPGVLRWLDTTLDRMRSPAR